MKRMPLLSPRPSMPPFLRLLSADMRHMGHCACTGVPAHILSTRASTSMLKYFVMRIFILFDFASLFPVVSTTMVILLDGNYLGQRQKMPGFAPALKGGQAF